MCVGHLEHKSTHAEDHAEQVHVVRRGVLQCRVGLCAGRFVPVTTQTYFNQRTKRETYCFLVTVKISGLKFI